MQFHNAPMPPLAPRARQGLARGRVESCSILFFARLAALPAALVEGEESGAPRPCDIDAFIAQKKSGGV